MKNKYQDISLKATKQGFIAEVNNNYLSINELLYFAIRAYQQYGSLVIAIKENDRIKNHIPENKIDEFEPIIKAKIKELYFLKGHKDYIHFKIKLIDKSVIKFFSKYLKALFNTNVFFGLLMFSIVINGMYFFSNNIKPTELTNYQSIIYSMIVFLSLMFHEFGHCIAVDNRTSKVKYIGFGLYNRVLPVLFADVSHIWQYEKTDRFIVNLGGVFIQLLINVLLIVLLQFDVANELIEQVFLMNLYIIAYSLIPFLRNDGYWVLSDLIGVNNLHDKSKGYLLKLLFNNEKFNLSILVYSILNFAFNILILYWIVFALSTVYGKYSIDHNQVFESENIAKSLLDLIIVTISLMIIHSKFSEYKSTISKIWLKRSVKIAIKKD